MKNLAFNLLLFLSTTSCLNEKNRKAAFMAGYYESSIVHYQFEMYPDSTFTLRSFEEFKGYWLNQKDTFKLFTQKNSKSTLVAQIIDLNAESYIGEFRILEEMKLKLFSPPKIIKYPEAR